MLLKQQNWEQWQGAGISSGNWGVCQEACSPAGGLSAPTPHLSSKHTQLAPPLLQYAPARSCRIFSHPWTLQACVHPPLTHPAPLQNQLGKYSLQNHQNREDCDKTDLLEPLFHSFGPRVFVFVSPELGLWGPPCLTLPPPLVHWLESG